MSRHKARELLTADPAELLQTLPKYVEIEFDDGKVVRMKKKALVYSWYFWDFHRNYPTLPLLFDHAVDSVLKGGWLNDETHIKLLEKISKMAIYTLGLETPESKEDILSLIYKITNDVYNNIPAFADRHVFTMDILDILEVGAQNPELDKLRSEVQPNSGSIADFYAQGIKTITENPRYVDNSLVQALKMNIFRVNQVHQSILCRGFPTEVDGAILSTPIMTNYLLGNVSLYAFVSESRSAAKHLYSAESPLQDGEYFARRLQLLCMVVEGIEQGDCGSKEHIPWYVKPPVLTESGRVEYPGDLKFLLGKYYLDDDGKYAEIQGNETHLYGKTIQIRSVIHCKTRNPHMVCARCFGGLSRNISKYANLGHLCGGTMTVQTTQATLSTKHHVASGVGSELGLGEHERKFVMFDHNVNGLVINPKMSRSNLKLIVPRGEAVGMIDLLSIENIENINPSRISSLTEIELRETMANGAIFPAIIRVQQNSHNAHFSQEFLAYVKEHGWKTDEFGNFVFDLASWDKSKAIVRIPDMEYSYSDHARNIAKMIESNMESLVDRSNANTPQKTLLELFDLVNSKLSVNLSVLEVMIYANMTASANDFGMARNVPNAGLNVAKSVIKRRSIGPAYVYESQKDVIIDPRSFFPENRPDSVLDVLITPREVVESRKGLQMRTIMNVGAPVRQAIPA